MLVDPDEAQEAGRLMILDGTTYHFCSPECQQRFHAHPDQYLGAGQGRKALTGQNPAPGQDPVCGMQVDQHQAEKVGLLITLDGTTYSFCSRDCMLDFLKDHKKYAAKVRPPGRPAIDPAMPEGSMPPKVQKSVPTDSPWAPIPSAESSRMETGGSSAPAQEWSTGWGKFPGAEYLGLKERKRQATGEPMPDDGRQHTEDAAGHAAGHDPNTMESTPPAGEKTAVGEDTNPAQNMVEKDLTPENNPTPGSLGGHHH
jgi:YHS domain-containing protein